LILVALVGCVGPPATPTTPTTPTASKSVPERVVADFEAAVKLNKDAFVGCSTSPRSASARSCCIATISTAG
jgi:hypothetical protein